MFYLWWKPNFIAVSQKTVWLGTFYMCIPAGYAVGYIYGGLVRFPLILFAIIKL